MLRNPLLLTETLDTEGDGKLVSLFYVLGGIEPGRINLREGAGIGVHSLTELDQLKLTPFVRRAITTHLEPLIRQRKQPSGFADCD